MVQVSLRAFASNHFAKLQIETKSLPVAILSPQAAGIAAATSTSNRRWRRLNDLNVFRIMQLRDGSDALHEFIRARVRRDAE